MPVTPFHLGPALLLGLIFFKYLDFPTFLIANVVVDIEPMVVILLNLDQTLHGFFHSFLGGSIVALILTLVMVKIRDSFYSLLKFFRLRQESSFKRILIASLLGIYIHILLDSRVHLDIRPFYPPDSNPFLSRSILIGLEIDMICIWCFIGAAIVYVIKLFLIWRRRTKQTTTLKAPGSANAPPFPSSRSQPRQGPRRTRRTSFIRQMQSPLWTRDA